MEQRDYLMLQIEQLGKVLGKILNNFLGLKSAGKVEQGIETSYSQFKNELDINIEELISVSKDELKKYILERQLKEEHLEILSEYFKELGDSKMSINKSEANLFLSKTIELLEIADEISETISFTRENEKTILQNKINQ